MKKDDMILAGAVLFAAVLVAQKTGVLSKLSVMSAPSLTGPLLGAPTAPNLGYNPADPGQYVMVNDLLAGSVENDYTYIPTFDQTVDAVIGGTSTPTSIIKVPGVWW